MKADAFEAASGNGDGRGSAEDADAKFQALLSKFMISPWLLDPRSTRMKQWDLLIALALVYTAIITPYEVAFIDTKPGSDIDTSLSAFPIYVFNM